VSSPKASRADQSDPFNPSAASHKKIPGVGGRPRSRIWGGVEELKTGPPSLGPRCTLRRNQQLRIWTPQWQDRLSIGTSPDSHEMNISLLFQKRSRALEAAGKSKRQRENCLDQIDRLLTPKHAPDGEPGDASTTWPGQPQAGHIPKGSILMQPQVIAL